MYCSRCGADNKAGSGFCSACGTPLKVNVENSSTVKKKSKKPLIIGIALLLVAVTVVAVIFLTQDKSTAVYVPELSTYFDADGRPYQTCTYTYNADGTLKQDIIRDYDCDSGSIAYTYITNYIYDSDSRIITGSTKVLIGDTDEILETYRIDYYYNKRGLVTEAIIYDYECPSEHFFAEYIHRLVFEYDIDWNLKSSSHYYSVYDEDLESYINSYKRDPFVGRLYSYTSDADGSRLKSVETQLYDDGRVSSSYTHSYTYLNDNSIECNYSQDDGYEYEVAVTYNCKTIENTSEIDMQSFMTIIAFL